MKNAKVKSAKRSFFMSVLSLILCFAMLLGTTWAWFTDEVTSGTNRIQAGNLDVELTHTSASVTTAASVKDQTNLFTDKTGNAMLWEPGAVSYENFTVANVGSLAFKYNMSLNITDYNAVSDTNMDLRKPLKVKVLTGTDILTSVTRDKVAALDWTDAKALADFKKDGGTLYPTTATGKTSSEAFQVIVYWQPTDNDNQWNVNNGKTTTDGEPLFIEFGVNLVATQLQYENDSFGDDYDANVIIPNLPASINKTFESAPVPGTTYTGTESVKVVNKNDNSSTVATVPAAAVKAIVEKAATLTENRDTTKDVDTVLYLSVTTNSEDVKAGTASYNIDLTAVMTYTDNTGASKSVNLTSEQVDNVLGSQIVTATIEIGKGLNKVTVKHNGVPMTKLASAETNAVGYYYDSAFADLTIKTSSFSPFVVEYEVGEAAAAVRTGDQMIGYYSLEDAVAAAKVGETVVLLKNVSLVKQVEIDKEVELDLNGKTISAAEGFTPYNSGVLGVKGGACLTVNDKVGSGKIQSNTYTYGAIAVTIPGETGNEPTAKLIVNGGTLEGFWYGVVTNGNRHNTEITINGGTMKCTNPNGGTGILHPCKGKLTINDGTFIGYDGLQIKGGTVDIKGGKFISTGAWNPGEAAAGSGSNDVGAALYVEGNYRYDAKINVSGGEFIAQGKDGKAVYIGFNEDPKANISITGGTYSSDPSVYVATGYKATKNEETGVYTVVEIPVSELPLWSDCANDENVVIDTDKKTVEISDAEGLAWFAKSVTEAASWTTFNYFNPLPAGAFDKYTINIVNDIDLGGKLWVPMWLWYNEWTYTLTINGNGHTIKNMRTDSSKGISVINPSCSYKYTGFIGQTSSLDTITIKNLKFDSSLQTGSGQIGVIVGQMYGNIILNDVDVNSAKIIGEGTAGRVAALIGQINPDGPASVTMTNCDITNCDIKAYYDVGGFIGTLPSIWANKITANNCSISDTTITGTKASATAAGAYACDSSVVYDPISGITVTNVTVNTPNTAQ